MTPTNSAHATSGSLPLALLACVAGALSALMAALFRVAPQHAHRWWDALIAWALGLGAKLSLLFGPGCRWAFPNLGKPTAVFAVAGMAACFTGRDRPKLPGRLQPGEKPVLAPTGQRRRQASGVDTPARLMRDRHAVTPPKWQ